MPPPFERVLARTLTESRRVAADVRTQHPAAEILYDPYATDAHFSRLTVFVRRGSGWRAWTIRDGTPGRAVFLRSRRALNEALLGLFNFVPLPR